MIEALELGFFQRVVIAHGDCIEQDAYARLREAWANPLAS